METILSAEARASCDRPYSSLPSNRLKEGGKVYLWSGMALCAVSNAMQGLFSASKGVACFVGTSACAPLDTACTFG